MGIDWYDLLGTPKSPEEYKAQGGIWIPDHNCWEWRLDGILHRFEAPARIWILGKQNEHALSEYWEQGRMHRVAGPAVASVDGDITWFLHGLRHRTDGPAVIWSSGGGSWYRHGELHREDGPAVIWADGRQAWHIRSRNITLEVTTWMCDNDITLPFTPEQQAEFLLRWG